MKRDVNKTTDRKPWHRLLSLLMAVLLLTGSLASLAAYDEKELVLTFLISPVEADSGTIVQAVVRVKIASPNTDRLPAFQNLTVEVSLPGINTVVVPGGMDMTFDADTHILTIPLGPVDNTGINSELFFWFTPCLTGDTENGTVFDYTATIYDADGSDTGISKPASFTVKAVIDWKNVTGSISANGTWAGGSDDLPDIVFSYSTATNRAGLNGTEYAETVTFSDTIEIPEGMIVTEDNIVLPPGAELNINTYMTGSTTNIQSFTVTFASDSADTAAEMPAVNQSFTISGATATGAATLTIPSSTLTDCTATSLFGSVCDITGTRPSLKLDQGIVTPPQEEKPDLSAAITKGNKKGTVAPEGTSFSGTYEDTETFVLKGFGNQQEGAIDNFVIVDYLDPTYRDLLKPLSLTTGKYDGAVADAKVTVSYSTSTTEPYVWTKLDDYNMETNSTVPLSTISGITAFKYDFGTVQPGFKPTADGDPTITYQAQTSSPVVEDATINNNVVLSYTYKGHIYSKTAQASTFYVNRTYVKVEIKKTAKNLSASSATAFRPGDWVEYTLKVTNNESVALKNIKVVDYLDDKLDAANAVYLTPTSGITMEYTGLAAKPGSTDSTQYQTLTWQSAENYTLAAGATLTITYKAQIKTTATEGSLTNEFWMYGVPVGSSGSGGGSGLPGQSSSARYGTSTITVVKDFPHYGIKKIVSSSSTSYKDGEEVTFEITIKNFSKEASLENPVIVDVLPKGLDYVSAGNGGVLMESTDTTERIKWTLTGTKLVPGGETTVTLTAKVDLSKTTAGTLTNNVYLLNPTAFNYDLGNSYEWGRLYETNRTDRWLDGTTTPYYRLNNQASVSLNRSVKGSIVKTVADNTTGAGVGDTLTYTVTIKNTGTDAFTVTRIVDLLPEYETFTGPITLIKGTTDIAYTIEPLTETQTLRLDLDTPVVLAKNDTIVLTYKTTVNADAPEMTRAIGYKDTNYAAFYTEQYISSLSYGQIIDESATGVVNWDEDPETRYRYQNYVDVKYYEPLVVPEITKTAYNITESAGVKTWTKYQNTDLIIPGQLVGWEVTIKNGSAASANMIDPYILDLMPDFAAYVDGSLVVTGGATLADMGTPTVTTLLGRQLYKWALNKTLAPGESVTFRFETKIRSDYMGPVQNDAFLVPAEHFLVIGNDSYLVDATHNASLYPVIQETGLKRGVTAFDAVDAYGYTRAVSEKTVSNKNGSQTAVRGGSIAVLPGEDIVYTLEVGNAGDMTFEKLVFIDRLPAPGDTGVVVENTARNSEFTVTLLDAYINDGAAGTIQYSTKTSFDSDDWAGNGTDWVNKADWTDDLALVQSIRVIFDEAVPKGESRSVTIAAHVPVTSPANAVAWNSFGFGMTAVNRGLGQSYSVCAEPLKVGVMTGDNGNGMLQIKKVLNDSTLAFEEDTFYFDVTGVYNGAEVFNSLSNWPDGIPVTVTQVSEGVWEGLSAVIGGLPYGVYTVTERDTQATYTVVISPPALVSNTQADDAPVLFTVTNTVPEPAKKPPTYPSGPSTTPPTDPEQELVPNPDGSYEVIDEEGTPVGKWEQDGDGEWIYEEYVPLGDMPQTGGFAVGLLGLLGTALVGCGLILDLMKKRKANP